MNRHYDPLQGRFTQVDPIGAGAASLADPQSWNMYSYVQNDPVNFIDPTGLMMNAPTCYLDGIQTDCSFAFSLVNSGAAAVVESGGFMSDYGGAVPIYGLACSGAVGRPMQCEPYVSGFANVVGAYSLAQLAYVAQDGQGGQALPFTVTIPVREPIALPSTSASQPPVDVRPSWENFRRSLERSFGSWEGFINSLFPPPGVLAGDVTLFGKSIQLSRIWSSRRLF